MFVSLCQPLSLFLTLLCLSIIYLYIHLLKIHQNSVTFLRIIPPYCWHCGVKKWLGSYNLGNMRWIWTNFVEMHLVQNHFIIIVFKNISLNIKGRVIKCGYTEFKWFARNSRLNLVISFPSNSIGVLFVLELGNSPSWNSKELWANIWGNQKGYVLRMNFSKEI